MLRREALGLLVPAVLALDATRFQFRTAPDRAAWAKTIARFTRDAFELAAKLGDASLVAELVETSLNNGVHTFADGADPAARTRDELSAAALPVGLRQAAGSHDPGPWADPPPPAAWPARTPPRRIWSPRVRPG